MKRMLLVAALLPLLGACTPPQPAPSRDPSPSPTASRLTLDLGEGITLSVVGVDSTWTTAGQTTAPEWCTG